MEVIEMRHGGKKYPVYSVKKMLLLSALMG
jgi:hypothetical protein